MQKSKMIIQSIHPYKRMYFEFYYNFENLLINCFIIY